MLYAYFGPYMPELIIHKGYSIERITTTLWLTTEGIFGLPIGVAATFVFVFVLFGAFLESTGGGNFFIELAYALTGRFSGGPAKTSVVASGFMGSVSGSAVGNVVATGSFTIPMMKKVGYRPHVAGAIEAAASTGGQLMPPIMGAGAFLMAEFTNTSYLTIIKVALVPAIMYYVTVLFFVHYEAKKFGLVGQPKESLPRVGKVVKEGLHFIIPVLILIYVLVNNYSPMMAGFRGRPQHAGGQSGRQHDSLGGSAANVGGGNNTAPPWPSASMKLKALSRPWKKGPKTPSWCRWPAPPPALSWAW
jgi:TRAP transporter 4TM/12TM fusion protein